MQTVKKEGELDELAFVNCRRARCHRAVAHGGGITFRPTMRRASVSDEGWPALLLILEEGLDSVAGFVSHFGSHILFHHHFGHIVLHGKELSRIEWLS